MQAVLKKIISILLVLSLLSAFLFACAGKETGEDKVNGGAESTAAEEISGTTSDMDARKNVSDGLPEKNYEGRKYTILMREEWNYEFEAEEQTGETINDAVYLRNLAVEDRFNVKITPFMVPGNWEAQDKYLSTLRKSIAAGDNSFDIAAGYEAYMPKTMLEGLYLNWHDIPYIDFNKPWWSKDAADELTIGGNLYMATGDIALTLWKYMYCYLFNKNVLKENNIEDPYKLVKDGKWTLAKLLELSKKIYKDVNGNGERDKDDLFGFGCPLSVLADNYVASCDVPVTVKGADGLPVIAVNTPKMIDLMNKLDELYNRTNETYTESLLDTTTMFFSDRLLFMTSSFENISNFRDKDSEFGIIPYPKYDEAQSGYYGTTIDGLSFFCVPKTQPDPEFVGIITEALCAESYKLLVPAFYDVLLKTKAARDEESEEMLDIIRDGVVFNFGYVFSYSLEAVGHIPRVMLGNKDNNFASFYEKKEKVYNNLLSKLLEKLTDPES